MQMVSEVMTRDVRALSPHESLQRAAQMMDELNVGAIPVCEGERVVGMITDRDITVRATAAGKSPQAHIEEAMSGDVRWCFEDQSLDDVMRQMADIQIRRVPVVSHDDAHRLVGIVALGDLATRLDGAGARVEGVMEKVSTPSAPDRSGADRDASRSARPAAGSGKTRVASPGGGVAAGAAAAGGTGLGSAASASDTRDAAGSTGIPRTGSPAATTNSGPLIGSAGVGAAGGDLSGSPERELRDPDRVGSAASVGSQAPGAPEPGSPAAVVGAGGGTDAAAGASKAGTAGSVEHRSTNPAAGPGGVNAAGTTGASGGTAGGTAGRGSKGSGRGTV